MAEAVVSLVLRTLRDLLLEETKFLYGISKQVKGLESQLKEMQCLLKDADTRQHESNSVRNWIADVRDLAYRSEDVIETYAVQISSKKGKGFKKLFKRFSCVLDEGITLHQIGSEILDIKSEIERVQKSMQAFGIKEIIQGESSVSFSNGNQQWRRQTYPLEIEDCFVGMNNDLDRLVSLVVNDKQHRVISIWGMGGIGKTTIARKVFNHFETKRSFESFAWICITQQCHIRSLLEDVLKQLVPQQHRDIMNSSNAELVQVLCDVQKARRCLIVLDDLWQIDHWNCLKHAFLVAKLDNKILLTTRKKKIAAVGHTCELHLLNANDGWELLKQKAFIRNDASEFMVEENLYEKVGKEMVHKCGYLPLGISLLGGMLKNKQSLKEWELVNKNMSACLYKSEGIEQDNEIDGVIDLSYEDLPSYLKPCFLYMVHYREEQTIYVQELYKLWIAEGMISSHENQAREETLMDTAELYLKELVSRCIVQVYSLLGDQRYKTCKLHAVVREFCLSKVKNEDFRLKVVDCEVQKLDNLNPSFVSSKTRRLTIYFTGQDDVQWKDQYRSFHEQMNNPNIRSIQFLKSDGGKFEFARDVVDLGKLKLLRVLVFENCKFKGGKLPREIGNLVCLRHLGLRHCELDDLPFSISNLTHLYTLDLVGTWDVQIPSILHKMPRLKHLHFPGYKNNKIEKIRLRFKGLDELETLSGFNSLIHDPISIPKMKNLRTVHAIIHDNKTLSDIVDGINTNWSNLRASLLEIREGCELTSSRKGFPILKKILNSSNLHYLSISVPIRKLPLYNDRSGIQIIFPNLVFLLFENCEIEDDPMDILEKLPLLEDLLLWKRSYVGEVMICHSMGFPKLKTLQLKGLSNLREWRVEEGAMPSLDKLKIDSCQNLKMIPDGLKFVVTLQKLQIIEMPQLRKRVCAMLDDGSEGGEDYYKVHHVPSILFH